MLYLNRTVTASVYVVFENKVLLHNHKKYGTLFPLGGKMNKDEVPYETAIREVYEESGLKIELYNNQEKKDLGKVIQLNNPMYTLLENIGHEVENIDFIFFAKSSSNETNPLSGESKELFWFSEKEISDNLSINLM